MRSVDDVTPIYRRITLAGDFTGFDSPGADDHLRLFFAPEGSRGSIDEVRAHPSREYTPVAWSATELVLDIVLHGDGPGATWAAAAEPGTTVITAGPRGALVINGAPDHRVLAGDLTALPAIRRLAAAAAPGEPVDAVLLAADPADEQELDSPGDLRVTWVRELGALVAALAGLPARDGEGLWFVAAEQSVVKPVRAILSERGQDLTRSIVKGYWKRGVAEYHAPHGTAADAA